MNQKFIKNLSPSDNFKLVGNLGILVADKNGNIKYSGERHNAILTDLLVRLAYGIFAGTLPPVNDFGTAASKDGIAYGSAPASGSGTLMFTTTVSAATGLDYVIWSGSRTISHNGSIQRFLIGNSFVNLGTAGSFFSQAQNYATQSAAIAVSSGDTISATLTISCSTT